MEDCLKIYRTNITLKVLISPSDPARFPGSCTSGTQCLFVVVVLIELTLMIGARVFHNTTGYLQNICSCILVRTLLKMLFLREAASTQDPRMGYSSGFRNLKNIMLFCFYRYSILTDHLSFFTLALGKLRTKLQWRSAKIYYSNPWPHFLVSMFTFLRFLHVFAGVIPA